MPTRHMDMAILLVLQTTTILVPKSTISLVANTTRALIEAMEMETTVPWLFVRVSIGSTGCGIYLGGKDIGR